MPTSDISNILGAGEIESVKWESTNFFSKSFKGARTLRGNFGPCVSNFLRARSLFGHPVTFRAQETWVLKGFSTRKSFGEGLPKHASASLNTLLWKFSRTLWETYVAHAILHEIGQPMLVEMKNAVVGGHSMVTKPCEYALLSWTSGESFFQHRKCFSLA